MEKRMGLLWQNCHDNPSIIAFDKIPGLCCQGGGHWTPYPELWEIVRMVYPEGSVAHRIDKYTTGVILVGCRRSSLRYLSTNWHNITKKIYYAVIKSPSWRKAISRQSIDGKTACTKFQVIQNARSFSLVRCELIMSGRTHQIRRHLAMLGSPIIGDFQYGSDVLSSRGGQMLHARHMTLRLQCDKRVRITAPLPEDFQEFGFHRKADKVPDQFWQVPTR